MALPCHFSLGDKPRTLKDLFVIPNKVRDLDPSSFALRMTKM